MVYALSPLDLQRHNAMPAGFELSACLQEAQASGFVEASHPRDIAAVEKTDALFIHSPSLTARGASAATWHAPGHEWWVGEAWRLEELDGLTMKRVGRGHGVFGAVLPGSAGLHKWIVAKLGGGDKGIALHGVSLSRVEVVKSVTTLAGFHYRLQQTTARLASNGGNNPFVKRLPVEAVVKRRMLDYLKSQFVQTRNRGVRVLLLWHGCSAAVADEIMSKGPACLAAQDDGFFGAGIYFTPQPEYAAAYAAGLFNTSAKKQDASSGVARPKRVILLCAVCVGSVYPISRAIDYPSNGRNKCSLHGQALTRGWDARYVLVDRRLGFQAAAADTPLHFDFEEVVVAHDSQVLPIAKVEIDVDLGKLRKCLSPAGP